MDPADGGGSGGIVGGGGGGIGAGKGKNIPNQLKLDAEMRREQERKRQRENDMVVAVAAELPPEDYGDGSQILKHWVRSYPDLLYQVITQTRDDCWAWSLSRILQFTLNKDRPTNQQHDLDVEKFTMEVRLSIKELKAKKKLNQIDFAVGSLKSAMDYLYDPGLERKDGRKGPKAFTVKSEFRSRDNASPEFVANLVETKGLVGIIVPVDVTFHEYKHGILRLCRSPLVSFPRHALLIVAYGRMGDGTLFFVLQNSWGSNWGVNGYARAIIEDPCDVFYLHKIL